MGEEAAVVEAVFVSFVSCVMLIYLWNSLRRGKTKKKKKKKRKRKEERKAERETRKNAIAAKQKSLKQKQKIPIFDYDLYFLIIFYVNTHKINFQPQTTKQMVGTQIGIVSKTETREKNREKRKKQTYRNLERMGFAILFFFQKFVNAKEGPLGRQTNQ